MISKFFFQFNWFLCPKFFFLIKLLTSGVLFSTGVNAVFVDKLPTSGILFSNSVSFAFFTKSVTSGIFVLNSALSSCHLVFKTKSLLSILFTFAASLS